MSTQATASSRAQERRRLGRPGQESLDPARLPDQTELETETALELQLHVTDREVREALEAIADPDERERHALSALRLGVLALGQARGELDAGKLRDEGDRIMGEVSQALQQHAVHMQTELVGALREYLDPKGGKFSQRVEKLLAHDGELAAMLRTHVAGDESEIAKTLTSHVGASSPLFRMLDPNQADSLLHRVQRLVEKELEDQRNQVLAQFSLDDENSALHRLVRTITDENGRLKKEFSEDFGKVLAQFSLDDDDSALSRMVGKVDHAHKRIVEQFSLDDDCSALSRLKKELSGSIDVLTKEQRAFQQQVVEQLREMAGRKQAEDEGVQHGVAFEQRLSDLLEREARRAGDLFEACGNTTGLISRCKKGDQVVELGPESPCPGGRIVFEAKEDHSYDDKRALAEIEEARRNRGAEIGVFVFSRRIAGEREPFRRLGPDLFVVWDPEDPDTDVYLRAAFSVARALVFRQAGSSIETEVDLEAIDKALARIIRQADRLDQVQTSGETIKRSADKIIREADAIRGELQRQTDSLQTHLATVQEALAAG